MMAVQLSAKLMDQVIQLDVITCNAASRAHEKSKAQWPMAVQLLATLQDNTSSLMCSHAKLQSVLQKSQRLTG